jgi:hypothetical protein
MDAPGDKAHDGQMLDHQAFLIGGERTVWPRRAGKDRGGAEGPVGNGEEGGEVKR